MKTSALIIVLFCVLSSISAHNWLTSPVSRGNQAQSQTGCRMGGEGNVNCPGPCDRTVSQITIAPLVTQRGADLNIQWNMHTHEGGFIRFAWCPTSQSDSKECFSEHVQIFFCKEIGGCNPNQPVCSTNISAPSFLSDGAWTLQWAYFGGWYNAGDYYACVDYQVSGGAPVAAQQATTFTGGDYNNPNTDVCMFYSTNELGICVEEPCLNGTFPLGVPQTGAPLGFNAGDVPYGSSTSANVPSPSPITSGMRISTPSTTGRVMPLTTNAVPAPLTTGLAPVPPPSPITSGMKALTTGHAMPASVVTTSSHPAPLTTGIVKISTPLTTGAPIQTPSPVSTPVSTPTPTPASSSSSSSSSDSCVSGYMKCLADGSYSTCNHGAWGVSQPCAPGTACSASGNYIYCIVPTFSTPSTPISTPVPSPSPVSTPVSTPPVSMSSSTSTSSSVVSGSCTLGYERCDTSTSYQTCGNGLSGPTWYPSQQCQPGLGCHPSATANNIYCY